MATTYQKLIQNTKTRRGRPRLPEEERAKRAETRRIENRRRMEARRRAAFVLSKKYSDEFKALVEEEYAALRRDNYATERKTKKK